MALKPAPTTTRSVHVESDSTVQGVRLIAAPPSEPSLLTEDEQLLHDLAPDLVLFPDVVVGAKPPWPDGENDYHPRPVEAFLDGAYPYVASPAGPLAMLYVLGVWWAVSSLAASMLVVVTWPEVAAIPLSLLAVGAIVATLVSFVLVVQAPRSVADLRIGLSSATRPLDTTRLGIRRSRREWLRDTDWARHTWKEYATRVATDARFAPSTYARAVHGSDDERYLEYWQFYVFNDWNNRHEADWELIVVRAVRTDGKWEPRAVACSAHFGGTWRLRGAFEEREGHPVVYVAKGSHAQYFESLPGGYPTPYTAPLGLLDLQVKLIVQNEWRDIVVSSVRPEADAYRLIVVPPRLELDAWDAEDWDRWWWLRFEGGWGARDAVKGPQFQETKWADPRTWVDTYVYRDRTRDVETMSGAIA